MGLRIIMMGTGDFAVPTFRSLYDSPHEVLALYTQPDRPTVGRHKPHQPMKELALDRGTPIRQPANINTPEELETLANFKADLILVAAYGQILSRKLLSIPPKGIINVHASLLPKYRGAAPINYAILKGETETGVTIIDVVPQLDAGAMLGRVRTPISPNETAGELEVRLAELAPALTCDVLQQIEEGRVQREPQDETLVTLSPKMKKEMGLIEWSQSAERIECHVRAMQPWPTPVTFLHQSGKPPRRFVIRRVERQAGDSRGCGTAGEVIEVQADRLLVQTESDPISIIEIQPDGRRVMKIEEFLRGCRIEVGDRFGNTPSFSD